MKERITPISQLGLRETLADRLVSYFSPERAVHRRKARTVLALTGGYTGGKRRLRSTHFWRAQPGDADAATIPDLPDLRDRSRDMERNVPIATGALSMQVAGVVGDGLVLQPAIDRQLLGLEADDAATWERQVATEFALFCKSLDFTGVQQFNELQGLALNGVLASGDVIAVRRYREDPGQVYGTKVQLVEADRLSNPNRNSDTETLTAGVETTMDGVPSAYHISNAHPDGHNRKALRWARVPARDGAGRQLVIHLFDRKRPDQTRGVPYLAPVVDRLKQLGDYTDSEVTAALVSSMFTVFITSDVDDSQTPIAGETGHDEGLSADELKLKSGAVVSLAPGEEITTADPKRPNDKFDPFVMAVLREVGCALDLPFELLVRHFTASYSASRAALEIAWQFFRKRRNWMARNFCDVVYEWFLEEAVASGRISAPGFFTDPMVRMAWLGCDWIGPARMSLDPLKESSADKQDVAEGFKTIAQVITERTGGSFEKKHEQRVKEVAARVDAGLQAPAAQEDAPPDPDDVPGSTDDDDEDETRQETA